jgi:L-malate glycosyltransferase
MACGLPIVATSIGGIPEIIKPFCGRLAEAGNPVSIAENIEYILDNPSEYHSAQIAQYAQEEFGHPVIGKRIADIYMSVLSDYHHV